MEKITVGLLWTTLVGKIECLLFINKNYVVKRDSFCIFKCVVFTVEGRCDRREDS